MALIMRIVFAIVKLALVIGIAGGLADLTSTMRNEATQAHKQGIVSLKQINKSLVGP